MARIDPTEALERPAATLLGWVWDEEIPGGLGRPPWHALAACRGTDPARWFPGRGAPTVDLLARCTGCPVRAPCLDHALSTPEHEGIWGGTTARQRRLLRKARREAEGGPVRAAPLQPPHPGPSGRSSALLDGLTASHDRPSSSTEHGPR